MTAFTPPRARVSHLDATALVARHAALCEEVDRHQAHLEDLRASVDALAGQNDADSVAARETTERTIIRTLVVLADIESALERLVTGTYGTCESCHGPIASDRLEAIPYVRRCITCAPTAPGLLA